MEGRTNYRWMILGAGGLGGVMLMYLFDPRSGTRRRVLVRDQVTSRVRRSRESLGATWRDARNRGQGLITEACMLLKDRPVSDETLVQRVRASLGGLVRHPSSIAITADNGRIVLRGPIVSDEVDRVIAEVSRVRGVKAVVNELETHDKPSDIPGLQEDPGCIQSGNRFELLQENWSPTARMSVGIIGAALVAFGMLRRNIPGTALARLGAAAVTRASSNMPWKRITGVTAGYRAVDINKTVRIAAPLDRVFSFWAKYADFPKYTTHVQEVLEQGEGRSRWTVVGPAGIAVSWNAVITRFVPNQELVWRTEPDSAVQHAGTLKFRNNRDGTTSLHAHISYNPPLGAIGHGVATTIGADLKTLLEEDLLRIKTVLEENTIPRDVQHRGVESAPMLKAEQLEM
jgi:uncharacterized membrane protein